MLLGIDLRIYPSFPSHAVMAAYCIEAIFHAIASSGLRANARTAKMENVKARLGEEEAYNRLTREYEGMIPRYNIWAVPGSVKTARLPPFFLKVHTKFSSGLIVSPGRAGYLYPVRGLAANYE